MATNTTRRPAGGRGAREASNEAQPILGQRGPVIQTPDTVRNMPIGLPAEARLQNAQALNKLLADTITLYHLYKKCHWQVAGHTFYQLHLLFDKHAEEQEGLIDGIAERVQLLGGVAVGMPAEVAEASTIERPPAGVEEVPVMIGRLLKAHEVILAECRDTAEQAVQNKDFGTGDLLTAQVIPTNELQVWFDAEHVVDEPLVHASDGHGGRSNG